MAKVTSKTRNNPPSMARKGSSQPNRKPDPRLITGRKSGAPAHSHDSGRKRSGKPEKKTRSTKILNGSLINFPQFPAWNNLSPERKIDVYGGILVLLGLVSLASFFAGQKSRFTASWVHVMYVFTGWGALLLPAALIFIGLWLIFRHIEQLPKVTGERLIGVILLYFNLLTFLHILSGGGWELASAGGGGGSIGGFFERLLVAGTGTPGALIALAAWGLIGLAMAIDIPIRDLFKQSIDAAKNPQKAVNILTSQSLKTASVTASEPNKLPSSFLPLDPISNNAPLKQNSTKIGKAVAPSATPASTTLPNGQTKVEPQFTASTSPKAGTQWHLPAIMDILDLPSPAAVRTNLDQERAAIIEETLQSLGAPGHVTEIQHGPTVTLFGIEPEFIETRSGKIRVRVGKIAALSDDLALALAAPRVRIQAPVPGRNYVGIEVPNTEISRVTLSEVMESDIFKALRSPLRFALGKNVAGKPITADLNSMPHLLIAGTTGSGKSVCINSILSCFLLNNSPFDLRLILVDPKRVELTHYNGIPHLLSPVIVDAEEVLGALQWMLREMDGRYHKFSQTGVRNIHEYNKQHPEDHLPFLVIIVDELADLMMLAPEETERSVTRLAQLARATGIHLILATQRPSVDVVTGLIKANFPARIAFAVASNIDSRVILDQPGAERLLGRGDLLYQAPDASSPVRLQGVYVSDSEIQRLVDTWRVEAMNQVKMQTSSSSAPSDNSLPRGVPLKQVPLWEDLKPSDEDNLMQDAIDLVRREGRASITMLQRHMRIGYTRAARLIDSLEEKKIIGPTLPNSQIREILDYGPTAPPREN